MENTAEFKPTNTEEKRKVGRKNDFIPFLIIDLNQQTTRFSKQGQRRK